MNFKMFNKFKALLLAGAMLVGVVACSDYDDDIAGLSDRIESLEDGATVTVDDLATQLAAIELTIDDLAQLTETVEGVLEDVEGVDGDVSDLTSSISADLAALETELKSYVDGEITSLSETIAGIYATIESLNIVAARVAVLEAYCTGLGETTIASELAALQAQFDALDNTVASWTGEELLAYITAAGYVTSSQVLDYGYVTTADVEAMIAGLLDETAVKLIVESYGYMDLEAVKALSYLTSVDIEDFITEEALADFLTSADLTNYVQFEDIAAFLTSADIANLVTNDALAEALSVYSDYVSTSALEEALKAYVTVEGSVSFDDLADFLTSEDLEGYLVAADIEDFITESSLEGLIDAEALATELVKYGYQTATDVNNAIVAYFSENDIDLSVYATNDALDALSESLASYATLEGLTALKTEISKTLEDYATVKALEDYVTSTGLAEELKDYSTTEELTAMLVAYIAASESSMKDYLLNNYFTQFDIYVLLDRYLMVGEVEALIEAYLAEYYTSAQIDATLAGYVTTTRLYEYMGRNDDMFEAIYDDIEVLEDDVETIYAQLDQIFADMDEFKSEVAEEFSTVWSELNTISSLQSAFMSYVMNDVFSGVLGNEVVMNEDGTYTVESTRLVAMEEKIYALQMQANATDEALTALANRVSGLEDRTDDLESDVDDLQSDVSNLQGMVQSLVYVPAYLDEMNSVCFGKVGRFIWSGGQITYLPALVTYDDDGNVDVDQRLSLDLKFRMSPASALAEVTEDNYLNYITLLIEGELGLTRSVDATDEGAFELTGYEIINAETGEFYVTITMAADTYPGKDDSDDIARTYAIALSVTDITDTDYITDYIGIDTDYFDIYATELAYTNEARHGTPTEAGVVDDYDTLVYTDDETVIVFFDDYDTYALNSNSKYVLFSSLYDTSAFTLTGPTRTTSGSNDWPASTMGEMDDNGAYYTGADGSSTNDYVKFANRWSIQIYNVAPPLIGDQFKTTDFKFTIGAKDEDNTSRTYDLTSDDSSVRGYLDILNDEMYFITENIGVGEEDAENRILSWIYGMRFYTRTVDVSKRDAYVGNEVEMTAQQFNTTIGRQGYNTTVIDVDLKLYKYGTTTLYDDANYNENTIGFTATSPVELEWESDPQSAQVEFVTLPETGKYTIEVIYTFRDRTVIHVTVPAIEVYGEPTYDSYSFAENFTFEKSDFSNAPADVIDAVAAVPALYSFTTTYRPSNSSSTETTTLKYYDGETYTRTVVTAGYWTNNPNYPGPNQSPQIWIEATSEEVSMTYEEAYTYYLAYYQGLNGYTVDDHGYTAAVDAVDYSTSETAMYYVKYDFSEGNSDDAATINVVDVLWNGGDSFLGYYADKAEFSTRILDANNVVTLTSTSTSNSKITGLADFVYENGILSVVFTPEPNTDPNKYPFGTTITLTFTVKGVDDLGATLTLGTITAEVKLVLPVDDVMERIGGYFVNNTDSNSDGYNQTKAIAYLLDDNYTYLVADKNLNVFKLADAVADAYEIEYVITEDLTNFSGAPEITADNKLIWNEWSNLSLQITAKLYYYDYVSGENKHGETVYTAEKIYLNADEIFYVVLDDPIADFETVELTIDASEGDGYVYLASALTLVETVSGNSENVFNEIGLVESYMSAFEASVSYEFDHIVETDVTGSNNEILLELGDGGYVVFTENSTSVLHDIEYVYKVTYTYTYGTRTTYVSVNLVP